MRNQRTVGTMERSNKQVASQFAIVLSSGICLLLILFAAQQPQSNQASAATTTRASAAGSSGAAAGAGAANGQRQQSPPPHQEASGTRLNYFGSFIGELINRATHAVSGEVFAVDEQTIFIKNFNYDGLAPDAYFWSSASAASASSVPLASDDGAFIVPDEKGSTKPLEKYSNKDIVLRLPEGKTLREIRWLSIWSRQLKQSVADIAIPRSPPLVIPRPLEIAPLSQLAHGVRSGPITIVDAQTLLVPDFHYDGRAPDAYFWLSRGGGGALNAASGSSLRLKDENGSVHALRKYQGETIVISLPDELTIYDFDHFGVWCRQYSVNFGQTQLPQLSASGPQAAKVPPSPKMLGIKPENKLNCEILYDDLGFEIRWVLDGDDIVMQLVGKIEPGEYMAFGLGKDDSRSDMNNADAVVAWVDRANGQVHAVDYFLGQSKAQCVNDPKRGSCPDVKLANGGDSLTLLHGAIVNGYSMVTFKRPQLGVDEQYDQHVYSDGQQSIIWAIGTLNSQNEIGYHRLRTKTNMFIDFARNPQWNCPIPDLNASMHTSSASLSAPASISSAASQVDQTVVAQSMPSTASSGGDDTLPTLLDGSPPSGAPSHQDAANQEAWFIPSVVCPSDRTFYAQVGPTGGARRGLATVSQTAWYINGLMVPELIVERGQAYKFIVEGGNDKTVASRRHPLYLTDSLEGGFNFKTDQERQRERLFGGVALRANDGQFVPTAEGRMCEWRPTEQTAANADVYQTFSAFQRTLSLNCSPGQAAVLKFIPDATTPAELFYQCYTHRFMGGRIRVVDSCAQFLASNGFGQAAPSAETTANRRLNKRGALKKRQSSLSVTELIAQTTEPRMSFEAPPFGQTTLVETAASGDFGDDVAASAPHELLAALAPSPLLLNDTQLVNTPALNLSLLEQILRFSPGDIEFLDDASVAATSMPTPQTNLVSALDLQQQLQLSQMLQNQQQQHHHQQQQQQPRNGTSMPNPPRGWSAYMRRLASIYYPVQQQLASILTTGPSGQQMSNKQPAQNEIAAASSAPSFSLASLVPKSPKIVTDGLSKSSISKKLNKLRIKSGRKIEPNHQHSGSINSNTGASTQMRPPTPDNEFNYDIFNNQLAQLELQHKQFQALESMAAAAAAAVAASPAQTMSAHLAPSEQQFGYLQSANSDDFASFNNFDMPNQHQSHQFQETLQQQQSSPQQQHTEPRPMQFPLPSVHTNLQQSNATGWPVGGSDRQQAVFITRLPPSSAIQLQQQPPQVPKHIVGGQWADAHDNNVRYPPIQPYGSGVVQQHQNAPQVTYVDAATGNEIPPAQVSLSMSQEGEMLGNEPTGPPTQQVKTYSDGTNLVFQKQTNDPLDSSTTTTSSLSASSANNELDHMLAIERYSKQSSERRAPSVVHPVTGETVQASQFHHEHDAQQYLPQSPMAANQTSAQTEAQPKRFSSVLIDRHIVASTAPLPPPVTLVQQSGSQQINHNQIEVLEAEQSSQSANLRHLNSSSSPSSNVEIAKQQETPSYVVRGSVDSVSYENLANNSTETPQRAQTTTVILPPVLARPGSLGANLDFFASEPPATTVASLSTSPLTTQFSSSTQPSVGPLVPSVGPPILQQQQQEESSLVFRSNLIEPITSTLVPSTSSSPSNGQQFPIRPTDSFTPIDLLSTAMKQQQKKQQQLNFRDATQSLRPPTFVQSMLSSHAEPFRPEPPVQVASYLSQHKVAQLGSNNQIRSLSQQPHSQLLVASQQTIASDQQPIPSSVSTHHAAQATSQQSSKVYQQQQQQQHQQPNNNSSKSVDLIILKPTLIQHSQQQLNGEGSRQATYMLKPEFLSTSSAFKSNGFRPIFNNLITSDGSSSDRHDLIHSSALSSSSSDGDGPPSRRVSGHLFERLSSLSSPPSTSMVLDPMLTSNSMTTLKFNNYFDSDRQQRSGDGLPVDGKSVPINATFAVADPKHNVPATIYGQPRHIPGRLIPIDRPKVGAPIAERTSDFKAGETGGALSTKGRPPNDKTNNNLNLLYKDNNTDNAILSHVMSLISSNAIPAPPLIPVASYSSADYFLPLSDHQNQQYRFRRRSAYHPHENGLRHEKLV